MSEKTNEKLKQACREMFFAYIPEKEIISKLGVSRTTLHRWVYGYTRMDRVLKKGWLYDREEARKEVVETVKEKNKEEIAQIFSVGLPLIKHAIFERARAHKSGNHCSVEEARTISQILMNLDKYARLEEGMATDIIDVHQPVTLSELKAAILKDPFIEGPEDDSRRRIGPAADEAELRRSDIDASSPAGDSIGQKSGA